MMYPNNWNTSHFKTFFVLENTNNELSDTGEEDMDDADELEEDDIDTMDVDDSSESDDDKSINENSYGGQDELLSNNVDDDIIDS